jgi:hypothetical protein
MAHSRPTRPLVASGAPVKVQPNMRRRPLVDEFVASVRYAFGFIAFLAHVLCERRRP